MNLLERLKSTGLAAAILLLTSCAANNYPELTSAAIDADGNAASAEEFEYRIGSGDTLEIFVWGYPDLSVTAPVRPDGRITTRLVEDMQASGRTPRELAREIERRYADFVNQPVVTVSVGSAVGMPSQQIRVVNASGIAQSVPYSNGMTMLDLLVAIGGLGEFASGNRTVLVRGAGEARQNFKVRASDLMRNADMSANVSLQPGDVVVIPQSWF